VTAPQILIVDDDAALLEALPEALRLRMDGIEIETCDSASAALDRIASNDYDAIVTDIKMPGMDGLALLSEIKKRRPATPTLLITGHGEHDLAVQALRGGAYDFIQKPIDRDYFVASLNRAIAMRVLDRRVEEQRIALERHAQVLDHVGDGVFLVDADGIVRLWNRAAAAITGLADDAVVGCPAATTIPGWAELAPLVPVAGVPGPSARRAETVPLMLGGRELWLSIAGVEFGEGTVYAFRDLTDERAVDELKTDFIATVSHEVRTPLSAIYGAAMTLRREDLALDEEGRGRLVKIVADEADRLARIVNEILLANHIDSGRLRLVSERVDPVESVRKVLESTRIYAPEGIEIELLAPDEAPAVACDSDRLRQVLANLVDNAVKYSPDGGRIEVRVEPLGDRVRFSVRDEGLGIPVSEQQRVFNKFYRLDPNLTRGVGGTGLGLYICRELVRRMGGRIWVASAAGEGSTFFVDVPLAARPDPAGTLNGETGDAGSSSSLDRGPSVFPQAL
jgi:signal transduction histidine kinase